jgi:hypothetical protein
MNYANTHSGWLNMELILQIHLDNQALKMAVAMCIPGLQRTAHHNGSSGNTLPAVSHQSMEFPERALI